MFQCLNFTCCIFRRKRKRDSEQLLVLRETSCQTLNSCGQYEYGCYGLKPSWSWSGGKPHVNITKLGLHLSGESSSEYVKGTKALDWGWFLMDKYLLLALSLSLVWHESHGNFFQLYRQLTTMLVRFLKQNLSTLNETSSDNYCLFYYAHTVNLRTYGLYYFKHRPLFGA